MKFKKILISLMVFMMLGSLVSCDVLQSKSANEKLVASGRISANEVGVASEIGGKVVQVNFKEGDSVKAGDVLFQLDDKILLAQQAQAQAGVKTAATALEAVKKQAESAKLQLAAARQGARYQSVEMRNNFWKISRSDKFDLPVWYYQKTEMIQAAQKTVTEAQENLEKQLANLDAVLKKNSNAAMIKTEQKLAEAQAAFEVAVKVQEQAKGAQDNKDLLKAADDAYEQALKQLEVVQLEYERAVTTAAAQEILEARSKAAIAQTRLDLACDHLDALQTGDDSLAVQTAQSAVNQAEAGIAQAEAALEQANASLKLLEIQLEKSRVQAPVDGVILNQSIKVGQIASPGGVVLTIGQLENIEMIVYVPESMYGQVKLGQEVRIKVDSFPDKAYSGIVAMISNQAEFTPRDVQTVEGRKTTVYAVKITAANSAHELKPGMPADVQFGD